MEATKLIVPDGNCRFIINPFFADEELASRVDASITEDLLYGWINEILTKIFNPKPSSLHGSAPYKGTSGVAYALHRVSQLPATNRTRRGRPSFFIPPLVSSIPANLTGVPMSTSLAISVCAS